MTKICCKHCNHIWEYTGHSEHYVTCPSCYYKVHIRSNIVKEVDTNYGRKTI